MVKYNTNRNKRTAKKFIITSDKITNILTLKEKQISEAKPNKHYICCLNFRDMKTNIKFFLPCLFVGALTYIVYTNFIPSSGDGNTKWKLFQYYKQVS